MIKPKLSVVANNTKPEAQKPERSYAAEIASGNVQAFSDFVKEKARYYYHVAYRVTLNREGAEDAVQNAFAKLWEKRSTIQEDGNLNAWLYRVVVNIAIDDKRRLKFSELNEEIAGGEDGDETLEKQDISAKVAKTLATLPPRQRAAVMMVYFDGYGQKEAADNMGINLKALESLLSRAKAVLKERLV